MVQIEAMIERADDGTFCVFCKDEIFSGMGATLSEAKENMREQMLFYSDTAKQEGFKYPAFLDEDFTVHYTVEPLSLMKYLKQKLN